MKNDSFLLYNYKQQGFDTRYIFNNQHLIIKHPPIHILRCASSRTSFKGGIRKLQLYIELILNKLSLYFC